MDEEKLLNATKEDRQLLERLEKKGAPPIPPHRPHTTNLFFFHLLRSLGPGSRRTRRRWTGRWSR
jgi:hypothetical protein